jgi:hypothetical protein
MRRFSLSSAQALRLSVLQHTAHGAHTARGKLSASPSTTSTRQYWPDTARGKLSASPSRRFLDAVCNLGAGCVQLELHGLIAIVTVDNPHTKNSFSGRMMEQLGDSPRPLAAGLSI